MKKASKLEDFNMIILMVFLNIFILPITYFYLFESKILHATIFAVILNIFGIINYVINRKRLIFENKLKKFGANHKNINIEKAKLYAHNGKFELATVELRKIQSREKIISLDELLKELELIT